MSLSAPSAPDPTATADAQQGYNTAAATASQEGSMVNQSNPYGSLTYKQIGTYPDGTPKYAASTNLTPAQQALLNQQQKNQGAMGSEAHALTGDLSKQYAAGMDTDQSAITKQLLGWQSDYMSPYFKQQQSNLNSQLAAQGITQGSEAYDNAQHALGNTQGTTMENAMATDQSQAYSQALSNYTTPIQAELAGLSSMYGNSLPGSVTQNLTSTPGLNVTPADYSSIAEQNYAQQNANYESTLNGLFSIPSALVGGWAAGGGLKSLMSSDREMKTDIAQVGTLFDGTPVYRYRYKSGGPMQIGLMAHEVAPDAVYSAFGSRAVDYERATAQSLKEAA